MASPVRMIFIFRRWGEEPPAQMGRLAQASSTGATALTPGVIEIVNSSGGVPLSSRYAQERCGESS